MSAATILGQRLAGRYRILRELAEGSTGTVYLAEDATTKSKVVVKLLIPDLSFDSRTLPHLRQRLQRQIKATSGQEGTVPDHIVDITDVGILSNEDLFVVMPYLQGDNLAALLRKRKILSWAQARTLVVTIGRLIAEHHREMLLEGNWPVLGTLQSSNCFCLRGRPRAESVKLINSAVDELIVRRQWRENGTHVVSLARYGAPELSTGERLDVRTDVYSFGVIIYELLTARVPFLDNNAARLEAMHLMSPVPQLREVAPAAKISEELEAVILRALEKRPDDRFPTMSAFVDALQAVKAKRLPAVRRGHGGAQGAVRSSRGDTMIMASPYFEGGDKTTREPAAIETDEGVDELAAAMEARADEASGELEGAETLSSSSSSSSSSHLQAEEEPLELSAPETPRVHKKRAESKPPKVIPRKRPRALPVVGRPEVIDDDHAQVAVPSPPPSMGSDTAPQQVVDDTQVRRRPQGLQSASSSTKPPVLLRRKVASPDASTVHVGRTEVPPNDEAHPLERARHLDESASTVRLPVVHGAAHSGFGEGDDASGDGGSRYWLWVVVALLLAAGALVASGGLGFISGYDEANGAGSGVRAEGRAGPPPTVLRPSSKGARELVERAKAAEKRGQDGEAYRFASESYRSEGTVEALELMGRSACRLGDVEDARWILRQLPAESRSQVQALCDRASKKLAP